MGLPGAGLGSVRVTPEMRESFLAFLAQAREGGGVVVAPPGEPEVEDAEGEGAVVEETASATERGDPEAAGAPVEVTAEELSEDLARRLSDVNQDLALAFEAWAELPEEGRRMIIEQARYIAELYPHIAGGRR